MVSLAYSQCTSYFFNWKGFNKLVARLLTGCDAEKPCGISLKLLLEPEGKCHKSTDVAEC